MITNCARVLAAASLTLVTSLPAFARGLQPEVQINANSVTFFAPTSVSVDVVAAKVVDPDGNQVFNDSIKSGTLTFSLSGFPDGIYRYEVLLKVVKELRDAEGNTTYRLIGESSGELEMKGGLLYQGDAALAERGWLASTLHWLIAPAAAQNVTVDSTQPRVIFDDTNSPGTIEYDILGDDTTFQIRTDGILPILLFNESTEDMSLGSGKLFLDGVGIEGRVGFSTESPDEELHANYEEVTFRLESTETSPNSIWDISVGGGGNTGDFGIELVESGTTGHPTGTVVTLEDSNGNVGIWELNPEASLHVRDDSSNSTRLLVEETAISGPLEMFELRSTGAGRPRFAVNNTSAEGGAGSKWTFDVLFDGRYAFSKVGTGVNEVLIDGSGNMAIQGTLTQNSSRAAKQDITRVDTRKVLEKVLALPLAEWRYRKDKSGARHLGPMADDFHSAFGLGKDDQGIATLDTSGVALAAIQGLKAQQDVELQALRQQRNQQIAALKAQQDREISQLRSQKDMEIDALRKELAELRAMLYRQLAASKPVSLFAAP